MSPRPLKGSQMAFLLLFERKVGLQVTGRLACFTALFEAVLRATWLRGDWLNLESSACSTVEGSVNGIQSIC